MMEHMTVKDINKSLQDAKSLGVIDVGQVSDGYHSFNELYDHRIALFIALSNIIVEMRDQGIYIAYPWKSRLHSDGTSYEGWFISGITIEGEIISYHLPDDKWDSIHSEEIEKSPTYDWKGSRSSIEILYDKFK